LLGVADQDACGVGGFEEQGEVGGAGLGGLVDYEHVADVDWDGAAELVAAFDLAVGLTEKLEAVRSWKAS
jgi:hypothetical protein